ncbi:histidine kinase [Actinocatenispora rupis]
MRRLLTPPGYRRWVFLALGAALAVAFAMVAASILVPVRWGALWPPLAVLVPLAVVVLPPVAVSLLPPVRVVEGAAVRSLLRTDLPEHLPPARDWDTRWRASLWFLLHVLAGAAAGVALVAGLGWLITVGQLGVWPGRRLLPVAVLVTVPAYVYLVAALAALLARCAPPLLGPSAAERLVAAEARARALAERTRLARDLHDSIGHALTVTTLQAAAAGRLLDHDPAFVRRALAAIEDTGRSAMADLDHALGLLRDEPGTAPPVPMLRDVAGLVTHTRAAGLPVTLETNGDPATVPADVSREAYRIVQEGLTNAARHAGTVPVTVRLTVTDARLVVEVSNPMPDRPVRRSRPGRGLAGMAERVATLHGTVHFGPTDGRWVLSLAVPLR